jgi:shikimate dehydrogenase
MNNKDLNAEASSLDFLPGLVGSFASPASENPTVAIMEAAFRHHGLHYRYINCEVRPEKLKAAVEGAKAMGWHGFNCSIPNKVEVVKYIDELGESARIIGAVNTVVIEKDGTTRGENTDGKGFVKAISDVIPVRGKRMVILGAGGAARAICVEMALSGVSEIMVLNIDESGHTLVDLINQNTPAKATFVLWKHTFDIPENTDIVINATPVGLYPNVEQRLNVNIETLKPDMVVADCIPNPVYTHFVKDAIAKGCRHVLPGMNMLINQAVIAVKLWTGEEVDAEVMRQELKRIFGL